MAQITLNSSGVASNGTLALQSNGTTTAVTIDTAQNVGVGVTPSASWGGGKAFVMTSGYVQAFTSTIFDIGSNAVFNGSSHLYAANGLSALYRQESGTHKWYNAATGTAGGTISFTQAMILDASGNLGIGTTSPTAVGSYRVLEMNGTSGSYISLRTAASETGRLYSNASQTTLESSGATFLNFLTNGTERARIDSSGRLLVGASSFTLNTGTFTAGSAYVDNSLFLGNTNGTGSRNSRLDTFTDEIYIVWANGNTDNNSIKYAYGGTAWVNTSDETLKDIIEPITNAVSKVCSLRSVIGKFKNEEEGVRHPFLIAQDVQAVLPEAVYINKSRVEGEPDTLGVGYTDVIPLLVAAIKEQQAIITSLTDRITALEQA